MATVRFTPTAIADLDGIKRYISDELFNPQAADAIIALIFKGIQTLESLPQTGARLKTTVPILRTYRCLRCKNYLVFYRVDAKAVSVVRVVYARRNYLMLLKNDVNNRGE
jgi:addiction module RelE/StbE family toxin